VGQFALPLRKFLEPWRINNSRRVAMKS